MNESTKTKQIAKNTVVLYLRMIITMFITLFSSRIVLQALGVSDFGLYNVVGGVVALLSFLRTSLTSSTQRFLSFELGRNDMERLKKVFSVSLSTHLLISIFILILGETLGLWFLNHYIQIPDGRETAANCIYQFAILSLCISAITVPYNADVISHERMSYYALVTIFESVLKLIFAYSLYVFGYDRLILYGGLMMLVNLIDLLMYWIYCKNKFIETKYTLCLDKKLFKQIFSFSGWTIFGQLTVVGANQGTSILINIFHTITANAAIGIAQQVNNALAGLTANFQTAFQPQLTKSYATQDYDYLNRLICFSSKISFFLLFLVSLPLMLNIDWILEIWLGKVPEYANTFCILYIIGSILNALSAPLWISVYATGKIKTYQIVEATFFFLDIVVVYLLFKFTSVPPTYCMIVKVGVNFIVCFIRLYFANKSIEQFDLTRLLMVVFFRVAIVSILVLLCIILLVHWTHTTDISILMTLILTSISVVLSLLIGFTKEERHKIVSSIVNFTHKTINA